MRRRSVALGAAGTLFLASGCKVTFGGRQTTPPPSEEVPRIDVDTAFAEVRTGQAVLVDVRSAGSFQRHRAAGAITLPLDELERSPAAAAAILPAGKRPILYCT